MLSRLLSKWSLSLLVLLAAACSSTPTPTAALLTTEPAPAAPQPSATPIPADPLVICLGEAPNTLNPYAAHNPAAQLIQQALYAPAPTLLAALPSLADGSAVLTAVPVAPGQLVALDDGQVAPLAAGQLLRPAGCRERGCAQLYGGGALEMDQLTVTFRLQPGLLWADGSPLTSADSLYAFTLDAAANPAGQTAYAASYIAPDELTLVWTGVPGWLDREYAANFWTPLPQHIDADQLTPTGLGSGAFTVAAWHGADLDLRPNPYFAAGTILAPAIRFQVVGTDGPANLAHLQAGECQLLDPSAAQGLAIDDLLAHERRGELQLAWGPGTAWEVLNFGVMPRSYDNGYRQISGDRPNFFGDGRVRQALAMCIDRPAAAALFGTPFPLQTYLPPDHPLNDPALPLYPYAPQAAATLLAQAGWSLGADGVRVSSGIPDILDGTRFEITYQFVDTAQGQALATLLAEQLAACGVQAILQPTPAEVLFAPGPDGPLFGRSFDLAGFAWPLAAEPPCHLYLSTAVPGPAIEGFAYSWGGWNLSGWQYTAYDAACQAAQLALPGEAAWQQGHLQAQAIYNAELPAIPLFIHPRFVVAHPAVCGLSLADIGLADWAGLSFGAGCP